MIKYLEKLWKQLNCNHIYETAYTEIDDNNDIVDHYIYIRCGKTKIEIDNG